MPGKLHDSIDHSTCQHDKAAGWLFYVALGVAALTAVAWTVAVGFNVEVI